MNELFLKILNMSISASWIILALLILRPFLKKVPKWINVLLWVVVAVRLLCPFSIESALSLIPSDETIPLNIEFDNTPIINSGIDAINRIINPILHQSNLSGTDMSVNPMQITIAILVNIWLLGVALLLIYFVVSYLRLRRKVDTAIFYRDGVFQSENVNSPFVLGIIKPKVYLPFQLDEQTLEHAIAHEQAHIHRKDHWWKPLGFLLLILHWFNPLMWLAYVLLCRDIELASDEKVIKIWDNQQRADYTQALVTCSINRRMISACPLAFGEVGIKERVNSIMNYKKPTFWIVLLSVITCVVLAVCFLTNPIPPRTPSIVLSDLKSSEVEWAQVTFWEPEVIYVYLTQEQIDNLVEILNSIDSKEYEKTYIDHQISIMLYCGDKEILLSYNDGYVDFAFDSNTADSLDGTNWIVQNDALNEFFESLSNQ